MCSKTTSSIRGFVVWNEKVTVVKKQRKSEKKSYQNRTERSDRETEKRFTIKERTEGKRRDSKARNINKKRNTLHQKNGEKEKQ